MDRTYFSNSGFNLLLMDMIETMAWTAEEFCRDVGGTGGGYGGKRGKETWVENEAYGLILFRRLRWSGTRRLVLVVYPCRMG